MPNTVPPCPDWCTAPADHGLARWVRVPETIRSSAGPESFWVAAEEPRYHERTIGQIRPAEVQLIAEDEGAPTITLWLNTESAQLTPYESRQLARFLVAAADQLDSPRLLGGSRG